MLSSGLEGRVVRKPWYSFTWMIKDGSNEHELKKLQAREDDLVEHLELLRKEKAAIDNLLEVALTEHHETHICQLQSEQK
eukprot:5980741-Amphidinium_carterae.1